MENEAKIVAVFCEHLLGIGFTLMSLHANFMSRVRRPGSYKILELALFRYNSPHRNLGVPNQR